jgi:cell fate regulator YaaT (PSP1 superfamily)
MITVVGVRFKKAGKIYYFEPDGLEIQRGDDVIVETARGIEFGTAVLGLRDVEDADIVAPLKKVIRIATEEDRALQKENLQKAKDAFSACQEKIIEHNLEMKLVEVEYTFDCNKVIFYFTADGRIDFRELVKDLASVFRTRIELRQIGVRDEAKIVNGIGPCGVGLCCANWLGDFAPVSIKMAKDQNLSLNPTKISGICGRLMCCLKYEHDTYLEIRRELPNKGERIKTPDGIGLVLDAVILTESVKVRHILNDNEGRLELSEDIVTYKKDQLGDNPVRTKTVAEEEPYDDMRFDGLGDDLLDDEARQARAERKERQKRAEQIEQQERPKRQDRSSGKPERSAERKPDRGPRPERVSKQDQPQGTDRTQKQGQSPGTSRPEKAGQPFRPVQTQSAAQPPKRIEPTVAQSDENMQDTTDVEGAQEAGQKPRRRRPRRRKKQ